MTTTQIQTITAQPLAGIHCENCGSLDPETDEGYTDCCNEPECWGGPGGFVTVVENEEGPEGPYTVATVRGACCGASVSAALDAAGIDWSTSHQDCNSPSCAPHARRY